MRDKRRSNRDLPQINERIDFPEIRVIDADGGQLGILTPKKALELAREQDLDLVLVSVSAVPPVCRIIDYGKYKFEQEKKAKEARKKQHTADVKEVKMRYKIEEHDYQVRVNNAKRFLEKGDKVKATINFRGREIQHANLAEDLLKRMAKDLEEVAEVQQAPKKEGRNMMMLLAPNKKEAVKNPKGETVGLKTNGSSDPKIIDSNEPKIVDSSKPKIIDSNESTTIDSSKPKIIDSHEPTIIDSSD